MLDFKVLGICKVFDVEEFLNFGNTLLGKINDLILLIYDEVTGLFSLNAHDRIHLGEFFHVFSSCHLLCKDIACLVKLCRLIRLT